MTTMKMLLRLWLCLVLAGLLAGSASAAPCPPHHPTRYVLAFDVSGSVTLAQLEAWRLQAASLVTCLNEGDAVRALRINANSGFAKAVWDDQLPMAPARASLQTKVKVRGEVTRLKKDLWAKLDALLGVAGDALETDVFGIFERVQTSSEAPTVLVVWSDLLHSIGALNLEKTPLRADRFQTWFTRLGTEHQWTASTLQRTDVTFVLPALDGVRHVRPVNDPIALRAFYTGVVGAMGGAVQQFGVDFDLRDLSAKRSNR